MGYSVGCHLLVCLSYTTAEMYKYKYMCFNPLRTRNSSIFLYYSLGKLIQSITTTISKTYLNTVADPEEAKGAAPPTLIFI